jgi:uncharacterized membrane protein
MKRFFTESDRLEAFSDGVIAVIITIMVLELRPPASTQLSALLHVWPTFAAYALSFTFVGIYWNNHHHMLQAVREVNGSILWANLHLLFWLSLVPFVTNWMGENHFAALPVALYGSVLLMAGIAYYILSRALIRHHGQNSPLATAVGTDLKGKVSVVLYALGLYVAVAVMWLIPDRRIERTLA